jgi:hypothetical protein
MLYSDFEKMKDGEAVMNFFVTVGKGIKKFFKWAWEVDSETLADVTIGSLIMLMLAIVIVLAVGLYVTLIVAAFNHSAWWIAAWIPGLFLAVLVIIQTIKGIMWAYEDFF